ncbi:unnamed protein product [Ectocarpus sp. 4 AP-2014]
MEKIEIPVVDLSGWVGGAQGNGDDCRKLAEALHAFGIVLVRDPRVSEVDNNQFLDQMEKYYAQSDGVKDARPEFSYQVGVTPEGTERPRAHCGRISQLPDGHRPLTLCPPEADPKWRFFWTIGPRPAVTKYQQLNPPPVVPEGFENWSTIMDAWGNKMIGALETVSRLCAVGLGLDEEAISTLMHEGPHLLAPTAGSNFDKFNSADTVLAGYHYDFNLLTIHGKSRYPGLSVWLRDGRKVPVSVPDGCLLVQAGKQLERLTGGHVLAGFHEVAISEATIETMRKRKQAGQSLWRVSSTCFGHVASDQVLRPLGKFATEEALAEYPSITAGDMMQEELKAINLAA